MLVYVYLFSFALGGILLLASILFGAQASREERLAVADVVLDNSGTAEALAGQVDGLWRRLRRGAAGRDPNGDAPDPGDAG